MGADDRSRCDSLPNGRVEPDSEKDRLQPIIKRMPHKRRLLLLLGTVLAAACSDPTTPTRNLVSLFVLRTVDAQPLPRLITQYATQRSSLVADTIRWYDPGEYDETQVLRDESSAPPDISIRSVRYHGRYAIRGDSVLVTFDCGPGASCIGAPFASLAADGTLTTAYRSATGLTFVRRYEQVSSPIN